MENKELVWNFHQKIRHETAVGPQKKKLGQFSSSNLANVDQTPLPLTFTNEPKFEDKGAKTVWVQGGSSGLNKCHCTVQLTLFADGVPMIYRGTGKITEQHKYDRRVGIKF